MRVLVAKGLVFLFITVVSPNSSMASTGESIEITPIEALQTGGFLNRASQSFVENGSDCQTRRCNKPFKNFAKEFVRILGRHGVSEEKDFLAVMATVLSSGHRLNSQSSDPNVKNLFSNQDEFPIFQERLLEAINNRIKTIRRFKMLGGVVAAVVIAVVVAPLPVLGGVLGNALIIQGSKLGILVAFGGLAVASGTFLLADYYENNEVGPLITLEQEWDVSAEDIQQYLESLDKPATTELD